jgi:hypothetical protein
MFGRGTNFQPFSCAMRTVDKTSKKAHPGCIKVSARLLGVCFGASILAACGGGGSGLPSSTAMSAKPAGTRGATFHYTGPEQTFMVPAGVRHITVTASAAAGSHGYYGGAGGPGGLVTATIAVTPGESRAVFVGGAGGPYGAGGFNGGANSGFPGYYGGGGGASDLRRGGTGFSDRVIVAGAGGGGPGLFYGGGGGGSSYAERSAKRVKMVQGGAANGNGVIILS